MTKQEKIAVLSKCMVLDKRDDGTEFYHFTDEAPEELKNLYLKHYEVRDMDYEIFSVACDLVAEIYNDTEQEKDGLELIEDQIYERGADSASIYTADRLAYLNIWNQEDISETMREYGLTSIADACAVWYDRQIEQAAIVINHWINA